MCHSFCVPRCDYSLSLHEGLRFLGMAATVDARNEKKFNEFLHGAFPTERSKRTAFRACARNAPTSLPFFRTSGDFFVISGSAYAVSSPDPKDLVQACLDPLTRTAAV
jgi:hypothetical protein